MENPARAETLQFSAFHSSVDEGFWHRLSHLKLNHYGIDDSPISVTGFIAPCSHPKVSNYLTLLSESLPPPKGEESDIPATSLSNRNRCPVPGTLCNTNTFEGFKDLDRENLLKVQAIKIWDDIESGAAIEDCRLLLRFLLISFADLKKWSFHYWFAFPSLVLDHSIRLDQLKPASECFNAEQAKSLSLACNNWRKSSATADVPFFIISFDSSGHASIEQLRNQESCRGDMDKLWFGFYDPCHEAKKPGWPLRNFIALIHKKWSLKSIRFFCYREARGFADMKLSLVGVAEVCAPLEWTDLESGTNPVGWELYKNEAVPRCITLAQSMDPVLLAESATDLNLKLMRWRALPSLDLNHLSSLKCLLLGAGTLGCEVARLLMAWGIRKITLVDNGRVAMSNPVRQSLYTFEDCLNGGDYKALAAAKSLKRIFPAVEAEGVVMTIPMPGHSDTHEKDRIVDDCKCLHDLIDLHDVIFLLTDTRESRWLPSLLCANSNKITINAALGFDSFLVMRHGPGPFGSSQGSADSISSGLATLSVDDKNEKQRLGCYFCNDVVAPTNSINNRTLDQQCTVTRPGLAPMASAHAVELLLALLHHPQGIYAEGEQASADLGGRGDESLGLLPHQIRGSIYHCSLMTLIGHASSCCTGCSKSVISEYRNRRMEFLLEAIKNPTYLEDLTGISDLMRSANSFAVDWDDSSSLMDDEDCAEI